MLKNNMNLVNSLIKQGWLKTDRIIKAFKKIKRVDFMPEDLKNSAQLNKALPIGKGQTISQPLVVAFMLELLKPEKGDKILDIGSGSGYTSALLGEIVGPEGEIIAIELIPELKEFGEKNTSKYNFVEKGRVRFICADGTKGYKEKAPFDKILASASAQNNIPSAWKKQVKTKGRIVSPAGASIYLLIKEKEGEFKTKEHPGFAFVPLKEK